MNVGDYRPYFAFWLDDFENDPNVQVLTNAERGAYLRLLCHQWRCGSIPRAIDEIAPIIGESEATTRKMWRKLGRCFPDGRNPRLEQERVKTEQKIAAGRSGGKRSRPTAKSQAKTDSASISLAENGENPEAESKQGAEQPRKQKPSETRHISDTIDHRSTHTKKIGPKGPGVESVGDIVGGVLNRAGVPA